MSSTVGITDRGSLSYNPTSPSQAFDTVTLALAGKQRAAPVEPPIIPLAERDAKIRGAALALNQLLPIFNRRHNTNYKPLELSGSKTDLLYSLYRLRSAVTIAVGSEPGYTKPKDSQKDLLRGLDSLNDMADWSGGMSKVNASDPENKRFDILANKMFKFYYGEFIKLYSDTKIY